MNVAAILQAHGFVPDVPGPRSEAGTSQAHVASHVPGVTAVPAKKGRGMAQTASVSAADPSVCRDGIRTALLALADRLGVDRVVVACIPLADLPLWAAVPADALPVYLRALAGM